MSKEFVPGVPPGLELTPDEKAQCLLDDFALVGGPSAGTHRLTPQHAPRKTSIRMLS